MLPALSTGHDGSLCTVHAGSAAEALRRLETLALMADVALPHAAVRQLVAGAIDLVVQQRRERDGRRQPPLQLVRQRQAPAAATVAQRVQLARADAAGDALDRADRDDATAAVRFAVLVDDEVDRARDLLPDRGVRQRHVGHQRERLHAPQRLLGRAGVDGRERALVT
ncbi:MAG TPA: ATPase, T2SS/T4P/T4SS family [Conexibacter sp.]|nr:ATPase, T2SS/T4P/T4SS family [Conexibacter sp.]